MEQTYTDLWEETRGFTLTDDEATRITDSIWRKRHG